MASNNVSIVHQRARSLTTLVTEAIRTHAVPAAHKIDAELVELEIRSFGFGPSLVAVADALDVRYSAFSEQQRKLQAEVLQDGAAQDSRDAPRDKLKALTSRTARTIEAIHGRETLAAVSLVGSIPTIPGTLETFVGNFLSATSVSGFEFPEPPDDLASFDFPQARTQIEALHAELKQALKQVVKDTKETQQARADRDRVYATWQQELRLARDLARAILDRSNQPDLADRILPTDRQITGEDPLEEPNSGETPPQD